MNKSTKTKFGLFLFAILFAQVVFVLIGLCEFNLTLKKQDVSKFIFPPYKVYELQVWRGHMAWFGYLGVPGSCSSAFVTGNAPYLTLASADNLEKFDFHPSKLDPNIVKALESSLISPSLALGFPFPCVQIGYSNQDLIRVIDALVLKNTIEQKDIGAFVYKGYHILVGDVCEFSVLWPGCVLNIVVVSLCIVIFQQVWFRLVRIKSTLIGFYRVGCGRCPLCGYAQTGWSKCPECGWELSVVRLCLVHRTVVPSPALTV